ncbi:MAG: NAD(P)H-hydrate dehydratase [Bacteroidota bacterium]
MQELEENERILVVKIINRYSNHFYNFVSFAVEIKNGKIHLIMIKILPIEKVREGDRYTIENEPIASINLMERAAKRLASWINRNIRTAQKINIVCGPGNNGGDGMALARTLTDKDYETEVFLYNPNDKLSPDNETNLKRLERLPEVNVNIIKNDEDLPAFSPDDVVVDALFGSGLTREIEGIAAKLVHHINNSGCFIISVDTPSGLYSDKPSKTKSKAIIKADYTLTFQFPKLGFMFADNAPYMGKWEVLDIKIHSDYLDSVETKDFYLEREDIMAIIKSRQKFSHKGHFGHALLISGSYGKMGAAVLASQACLRTGAGLLTTHIPKLGYNILQTSVPEAMTSIDEAEDAFSGIKDIQHYQAIGTGPGIGMGEQTQNALKLLIQNSSIPLLFDADAINILAENKTWISFVPKNSIFTPHPKEFERLAGKTSNDFETLEKQREFSVKYGVYVVLKGAHTAISSPDGNIYFNSTGNPGMATAGAGDVLTGIILGLLSQNYEPMYACLIGVYLHGLAGDVAAEDQGWESLISRDIIKYIGKAYNQLK